MWLKHSQIWRKRKGEVVKWKGDNPSNVVSHYGNYGGVEKHKKKWRGSMEVRKVRIKDDNWLPPEVTWAKETLESTHKKSS